VPGQQGAGGCDVLNRLSVEGDEGKNACGCRQPGTEVKQGRLRGQDCGGTAGGTAMVSSF
jgi:hypothetical protein